MSSEDLKTAWKEFCESNEHEEKVQYLDKFLDLLIDSTPLDIPLVSKLNFGKHQVISGYIGSHFLIDLGKLCGNTAFPYFAQKQPDSDQIVNRRSRPPLKDKSLQLNERVDSLVEKKREAKQPSKKSKSLVFASGGGHSALSGNKLVVDHLCTVVENSQVAAGSQVNGGLNQYTLKEFLTANEDAAPDHSFPKGDSMEVEESVQSFATTDHSHSNESRSEESISSAKISRVRLPLSSDAHKLKMSAGPVPVFSDKVDLPHKEHDSKLGKNVDFVSSNGSSIQSGSNELYSDASDLAETPSKDSKTSVSSFDVDKTGEKDQIEAIGVAERIYHDEADKKVSAVGQAEDAVGQAEGAVGQAEGAVGQAEGAVGQAGGAVGQAEGAVGQTEGAVGQTEGAVGQTEGAVGQTEGAVGQAEGAVGQANVTDEFKQQPEQNHQEDAATSEPLDRMNKIIKFLCEGRGAKILMVLDQIGVVGSATGFHIMKFLGHVFEHLLNEMMIQRIDLKIHEPTDTHKYDSMLKKIHLKDIFKPLIFPPAPPPMHPTSRVEDIINKDSAQIAAANLASQKTFTTPRRHFKKTKIVKKPESGSWLQNIDKRSVANTLYYSNKLQFCECFHLESILKSKKTRSDSFQMRPKTLCEVCLMETILSLMTQFSLFDSFSKSVVIQSSRNSKHVFDFNNLVLSKLSGALQKQGFCDSLALNITGKFGHSLIKMFFAACQNFLKNVVSYQQLSTLNVSSHLYKWLELLHSLKENVLGIAICNVDHSKFDLFVINSLNDCVSGVFYLLTEITCDRDEPLFENKETQVMKNFLSNENLNFLKGMIQMLMNDNKFSPMAPAVSCCIAKFVIYLKLWKGDYPHKKHCSDISHKSCNSTMPTSHHFAQYGNLKDSANCLVAITVNLLLKTIGSINNVDLCKYIIDLCKRCGICCCMNLSAILRHLLNNFESRPMDVQNSILSLISSILLIDFNCQRKNSSEDNVDCTSCQEELEHENSNAESGRWFGLTLYYKYFFIDSVATLVTDHLSTVMQSCKPQIIGKIYTILLKKVMETLVERSFFIFQNFDVNDIVVGNLTKCVCLCFSTKNVILTKCMKDNALAILNHGLNHDGTKKEIYDLLCCLVSHEQAALEQNVPFLEDFSALDTTFSNILSREVSDLTESWQRRFVFQQNEVDDNLNLTPIVKVYADTAKVLDKREDREILSQENEQSHGNILSSTFDDASLEYSESFGQKIHEVGFVFPSNDDVTFNDSEETSKVVSNKSLDEVQIYKPSLLVNSVKRKISDNELFCLFQLYARISSLWHSVSNRVVRSKSFRAFFSSPAFRDDLTFLVTNLMTHLAKDCKGASKSTYVVQRNREETLLLCSSLLTTIVHCFQPNKDCEDSVEAFEEVRCSILNMKSTNCDFVKSLTSLLFECASESTEKIRPYKLSTVDHKIFFDTIDILQEDSSSASEGYAADSDSATPKTYKCASPLSIPKMTEKPPLVCPELMLYSLDLLISHHEKFLEALNSDIRSSKDVNSSVIESSHNFYKRKNDGQNKLETEAPESKKLKNVTDDECVLSFGYDTVDQTNDSNLDRTIVGNNIERKNIVNLENESVCENNEHEEINNTLSVVIKGEAGSRSSQSEYVNGVCKTSNELSNNNVRLEENENIVAEEVYSTKDVKILNRDDIRKDETNSSVDSFPEIASDEESDDQQENDLNIDNQLMPVLHSNGKSGDGSLDSKKITITDETGTHGKKIVTQTEKQRTRKHKTKIHKKFLSAFRSKGEKGFQPLENQVTIQKIEFCKDVCSLMDSSLSQNRNSGDSTEMLSSTMCFAPIKVASQMPADNVQSKPENLNIFSYQTKNVVLRSESSVYSTPLEIKVVTDNNYEVDHATNLLSSLESIFNICKNSKKSCSQLHNFGFLNKLISGFENIIKDNNSIYKSVIAMIMDIWAEIAQWHIKPSDLSAFFGLFKSENSPSDVLCRSLSKILESTGDDPHYFLKFPCPSISLESLLKGDSISQSVLSLVSFVEVQVPISKSVTDINHLRKNHLKNNILSCISISPIICPIPKYLDWVLYSSGVSFATWIKFEARNIDRPELTMVKTDNLGPSVSKIPTTLKNSEEKNFVHWRDLRTRNHLFSIGTQKLMYSVYAKPNMHKLYVSLTTEDHLETIFLDEVSVHDLGLSEEGWHHLAVVIPKVDVEKGAPTSLTFIVDGLKTVNVSLKIPPMKRIERNHSSYLLVGHIDTGSLVEQEQQDTDNFWKEEELQHVCSSLKFYLTHSLSMGVTFLFRDQVLNREKCCSLMSLGRNAVNILVPQNDSELILYPSLITKTLLQQNLNLSFLFKNLSSQLFSLKSSLLLLYSPKNYLEYTIYEKLSSNCNYNSSRTHIATLFGTLNHVCTETSDVALLRIGGASQLVFLAARLCEMKKDSKALSDCLSLLLKCCHADPIFATQFSTFYGSSLICRLLKSPSVPTDFLVLKVLVEGCLDSPVTKYIARKNIYKILNIIPSLLVDRGLFNSLLINWRCLYTTCSREYKYCCVDVNGTKLTFIGFILSVINILLQDSNPYRHFNLFQLRTINTLQNIIAMFEEMIVEGIKLESICQANLIADSVTRLVFGKQSENNFRSLNDSEDFAKQNINLIGLEVPSISGRDLKAVGDFLIFLHPDKLTIVSTAPNHAYYITKMSSRAYKTGSLTNLFNLPYESEEYDSKHSQCTLQTEVEDFYEEAEDALGIPESPITKDEDSTVEEDLSLIPEGKLKQFDAVVSTLEKDSSEVASAIETTTRQSGSVSRDASLENTTDAGVAEPAAKSTVDLERHSKSFKKKTRPVVTVDKKMDGSSSDSDNAFSGQPSRKYKKKPSAETKNFSPLRRASKEDKDLTEMNSINSIVIGLINVVEKSIKESDNSEAMQFFSIDLPIVLANNPDETVRAAALQLFRTMLLKSPEVVQNIIFPRNVTYLIANQLYKHGNATESLVSNALALALKFDSDISELSSYNCILDSEFKMCLLVPFLALLPNTVSDVTLCHNALTLLHKILMMNETFILRLFHKTHLMDSLLLTLRNCSRVLIGDISDTESLDQRESSIIVDDVTVICSDLIKTLIASPVEQAYSTGLELLNHLNLFTRNEADSQCYAAFLETEATVIEFGLLRLINASVSCKRLNKSEHSVANLDDIKVKLNAQEKAKSTLYPFVSYFKFHHVAKYQPDSENEVDSPYLDRLTNAKWMTVEDKPQHLKHSPELQDLKLSGDKKLSLLDVVSRFKDLLRRSLDFIITAGPLQTELNATLQSFVFSVLDYMSVSLSHSLQVNVENKSEVGSWSQLTYLCRENLKWHFLHLANYIVAPTMALVIRVKAIKVLAKQDWMTEIFCDAIPDSRNLFYRFGIFLHEFLYHQGPHSSETEDSSRKLIKMLADLDVSLLPVPDSTIKQWTVVTDEMNCWAAELNRLTIFIRESYSSSHERLFKKHRALFEHLCIEANIVTSRAVELQNSIRKNVLRRVKYSQYSSVKLTKNWVELTEALCHEKATWNFPESYPRDWKLDSTEGPTRIRKKMMRCNLDIPEKFFMSHVSRPGKLSAPLQEILLDNDVESPLSHIVESLHEDESLEYTCHALFITPTVEQKGEFLICNKRLYFIGEEMTSQIGNSVPIVITRCWQNDVINEFHLRRYRLRDCALEIFAQSGSAFIVFDSEKDREQVLTNLRKLRYPNIKRKSKLKDLTLLWRDGTLTNFEYLTQLNKFAGRSFSDLMQYPVFPFILKDYDSATLDISNPEIYRDLRKPVPIQSKDREQYFKSTYENTAHMCPDGPYNYSSHYSNSGIVLYYMIRVPPFTQVFLDFQDGNFDVPDRAFHTLKTTWRLASSDSTTAIRELIPEFFFLPETFENSQGFNLGLRQNDEVVNHVELPRWCHSNPRRFVLIHRALLESPFVTKNLPHWVDLIFGYKQAGKAAVEAINVFHPATYFGYDVKVDDDEVSVEARKTMIKTYGQTPLQLFKSAHPKPLPGILNYTKPLLDIPSVVDELTGLHWGEYALSPSDPNPTTAVCRGLHKKLARLEPLWDNEMAVTQSNTTVFCLNPGFKASNIFTLSWGHNDGILRSRRFETSTFHPVICHPTYNQVSCGAVLDNHLWVGTECGQVMVYVLGTNGEELSLTGCALKHPLIAHSAKLTNIVISKEFKVAFTGGEDGTVALWDTKWLTYIRSVTIAGSAVALLAVSGTLGDWVVVCNAGQSSSIMKYYTINAQFVDSITTKHTIKCITFSNAPEGRNVNVIAACLSDRTIRLYSTWDLTEVKRIDVTSKAKGLGISLNYTPDNTSLCMVTENHILVVWKTSQKKSNDAKFSFSIK